MRKKRVRRAEWQIINKTKQQQQQPAERIGTEDRKKAERKIFRHRGYVRYGVTYVDIERGKEKKNKGLEKKRES